MDIMKLWKKHGPIILLLAIIICACFGWIIGAGIVSILLTTLPCGIIKVNTTKWLWYTRQFCFSGIGLLYIFG